MNILMVNILKGTWVLNSCLSYMLSFIKFAALKGKSQKFFFFLSLSKAILRTAELPSLCNVISFICELFVPHFAMAIFMCIYLHYRINKRRDTSFEFSSILSTVDLSKHFITAWIIRKFIQLVNFVTFIVFFFPFGNRVWLNLYERALSVNELLSHNCG